MSEFVTIIGLLNFLIKFMEPAVPNGFFSSKYVILTPNLDPLPRYFFYL